MKTFSNYSKILLYILIGIIILIRILSWQSSIKNDYAIINNTNTEEANTFALKVCSVPKEKDYGVSFDAKIISESKLKNNLSVQLKHAENYDISYGDVLKLSGFLSLGNDAMNPGNFDYRYYLKSQGICGILKSDIARVNSIEKSSLNSFYAVRTRISQQFFEFLPYEEASLVNALITGSKDELTQNAEEAFKRAGVYHIVAVSGLHLNMFILFLSYLYYRIPFKKRKRQIIIIIGNLFAVVFMLMFTGFGVSVKRAAIMAVVLSIAPLVNREYSSIHSLFTAMILILLKEPFAYMDIGFQLSFLSTFGIIIAARIIQKYKIYEKRFSLIIQSLMLSGFAWIFTFMATVCAFHEISLITLISNMIILPLMPILLAFSYIFAILCAICTPGIIKIAAIFMVVPSKAVIFLSELLASIPAAYVPMSEKGALIFGTELFLILILVFSFMNKKKFVSCAVMSLIIFANSSFLVYNRFNQKYEIHFVNVGQGECSIIRTPGEKNILIDCGSESVNNVYENNVFPYMNYEGINKIDIAFVTHYHTDHANGIIPMIEDKRIKTLILPDRMISKDEKALSKEIIKTAMEYDVKVVFLAKGDSFKPDSGSECTIMNPPSQIRTDANDASTVIKFTCNNTKILFAGDIEEVSQYNLTENDIKADILKVPHHGGFSAMSEKFADAVDCDYAVISCGIRNLHSHPSEETLNAYSDAKILRTDKNKTIKFVIDKDKIKHYTYSNN